jgi:hypothetical protein
MMMIALSSSLIGAVLGTRLRVFVLLPFILLGLLLVTIVSAFNGVTIWWTLGAAALWAISLQLGYLGGLMARVCLASMRVAPNRRSLHSTITRN